MVVHTYKPMKTLVYYNLFHASHGYISLPMKNTNCNSHIGVFMIIYIALEFHGNIFPAVVRANSGYISEEYDIIITDTDP